jgi:hypothetical protein
MDRTLALTICLNAGAHATRRVFSRGLDMQDMEGMERWVVQL